MARPQRTSRTSPNLDRTIERVAIAALAAIATRGNSQSIAAVAITIFIVVVVVEELGRRWIWYGKAVTLRDVAFSKVGDIRIQRSKSRRSNKRRRRRSRSRRKRGSENGLSTHSARSDIQG